MPAPRGCSCDRRCRFRCVLAVLGCRACGRASRWQGLGEPKGSVKLRCGIGTGSAASALTMQRCDFHTFGLSEGVGPGRLVAGKEKQRRVALKRQWGGGSRKAFGAKVWHRASTSVDSAALWRSAALAACRASTPDGKSHRGSQLAFAPAGALCSCHMAAGSAAQAGGRLIAIAGGALGSGQAGVVQLGGRVAHLIMATLARTEAADTEAPGQLRQDAGMWDVQWRCSQRA